MTRPADCDLSTVPPGLSNPADSISDSGIKKIISEVVDGTFTAGNFQKFLTNLGISDIVVDIVGLPSSKDGKGQIVLSITITGTRPLPEYIVDINLALSHCFSIKITQLTTHLEPVISNTPTKRHLSAGTGSYISSTELSAVPPDQPGVIPGPDIKIPEMAPQPEEEVKSAGVGLRGVVGLVGMVFVWLGLRA
jgi:hypothetical protein